MTKIFTKDQIKSVIKPAEAIEAIEQGFKLMAQGNVVIAPLSSLNIGSTAVAKVKYGFVKGQDTYVIKVGSFFPENAAKGKQTINASMQIYNQHTGEFEAILLDEAYLTNVRTAAAGATVIKHFSPKKITKIGIVGTGVQARMQLEYLQYVTDSNQVMVWGRSLEATQKYKNEMEEQGFSIELAKDIKELAAQCNVIIAATSTTTPILFAEHIQKGTLVISVGADTQVKQELDSALLQKADILLADSKEQTFELGNIAHALREGKIMKDKIIDLGVVLEKGIVKNEDQIVIANLTGVAIQDIQIANLAYQELLKKGNQ